MHGYSSSILEGPLPRYHNVGAPDGLNQVIVACSRGAVPDFITREREEHAVGMHKQRGMATRKSTIVNVFIEYSLGGNNRKEDEHILGVLLPATEHAVCDTEHGGGSGLLGKRVYGRQDYRPTAAVRLPQDSYKPFWSDSKEFTRKMSSDCGSVSARRSQCQ